VGGAIASDVHEKNHHKAGCFSACVLSFDLLLPNGEVAHCSRENNRELFLATCGGMGLTGIILTATLNFQPIQSSYIHETIIRCQNLEEIFCLFEEHWPATYSVAWVDCLAKGEDIGRSILMLGEHSKSGQLDRKRQFNPIFTKPATRGMMLAKNKEATSWSRYLPTAKPHSMHVSTKMGWLRHNFTGYLTARCGELHSLERG
jgi:hypothetical protein